MIPLSTRILIFVAKKRFLKGWFLSIKILSTPSFSKVTRSSFLLWSFNFCKFCFQWFSRFFKLLYGIMLCFCIFCFLYLFHNFIHLPLNYDNLPFSRHWDFFKLIMPNNRPHLPRGTRVGAGGDLQPRVLLFRQGLVGPLPSGGASGASAGCAGLRPGREEQRGMGVRDENIMDHFTLLTFTVFRISVVSASSPFPRMWGFT